MSLRLAKLEERLGRRLLARTPRAVSLTPDGSRLLPHARAILAAHDRAVAEIEGGATRGSLRLAVSDHAAGGRLASALAALRVALPLLAPEVTVGLSGAMLALYDRGEAEAVILRRDGGREGTRLYWHGSSASRMLRNLSEGQPACLTVTHFDSLVLARCGFNHSADYRSVMAFGQARLVADPEEKCRALVMMVDRFFPHRTAGLRQSTEQEIKATAVIAMEIESASAKIRAKGVAEGD